MFYKNREGLAKRQRFSKKWGMPDCLTVLSAKLVIDIL